MSATTADPSAAADPSATYVGPDEQVAPSEARMIKMMRKVRRGTRRAATATGHGIAASAKFVGRTIKKTVIGIGNGITRTVGAVVATAAWILRTAISAVAIVVLVLAAAVLFALAVVVSAVVMLVASIADLINRFLYRPFVWLAKGRPMPYASFKVLWETQWDERLDRLTKFFRDLVNEDETTTTPSESDAGVPAYDDVTIVVPPEDVFDPQDPQWWIEREVAPGIIHREYVGDGIHDEDGEVIQVGVTHNVYGQPYSNDELNWIRILDTKAEAEEAAVWDRQEIEIPGADVSLVDPRQVHLPHDITPHFDFLDRVMEKFDAADVEASYEEFLNDADVKDLLNFFRWSMYSASTIQERSYWMGRVQMLDYWWFYYDRDHDMLDENGRIWALVYHQLYHDQKTYSLKHVRAGFKDQVTELMAYRKAQATTGV